MRAEIRIQARTLLETLPLDTDRDGFLSQGELDAGREEVKGYVVPRLELVPLAGGSDRAEEALGPPRLERLAVFEGGALELPWVELVLVYPTPEPVSALRVENRLFLEQNPGHTDYSEVAFGDEAPQRVLFGNGYHAETFRAARLRRPGVALAFLRLGVAHILGGYDHLAFLLALLVASRGLSSLFGVVTAFTVSHSVTLALAALDVVHLPGRLVELSIALSIAYVACDNLLRRGSRTPWIEAFVFGFLHGFGFAGFLGEALAGEPLVLSALFGFNLGVEVGQIVVVVGLTAVTLLLARLARRLRPSAAPVAAPVAVPAGGPVKTPVDTAGGLAPPWLRNLSSACVALLGFYWFVQRAGWI